MLATRVEVQKQATGVVVGIVGPQGRRLVTFGTMGRGDRRPVSGDTVFEVGSLTKVFTALLLADMVRRGDVALEDPVARYHRRPPSRCRDEAAARITLGELATHTSGLPLRPTNLVSKDPENKYSG